MNLIKDKVIGIVGGMGPHSGCDLFEKILSNTNAKIDQEHLSIVLMSFPNSHVDRTLFLEGEIDINPAHSIVNAINKLENSGAEVIGISCNTAYSPKIFDIIIKELTKSQSNVNLLNMPFETCMTIKNEYPEISKVGVMTTNGTYKSEIYKKQLQELGLEAIIPDHEFQHSVIHPMIYNPEYGIKSNPDVINNYLKILVKQSIDYFKKQKAEAIVLGCTELSLVIKEECVNGIQIIDSTKEFSKALIREATTHQKRLKVACNY